MPPVRRLAAILAADVAGYSRLMGADEEGTLTALKAIRRELLDPTIAAHNGRLFKTTGDGLLIEFSSVVDALRCASEVQREMGQRNARVPPDSRIEFRIGIHQGDVVVEDSDIFGDGVNVAARLEGLAEPGGICVSARVAEDAAGKLDLAFADMGEQQLKNIARPVRAYAVDATASPRHSRRRIVTRRLATAVIVLAVAGLGATAWWAWPRLSPPATTAQAVPTTNPPPASEAKPPPRLSIVVLPFANLSNDPDQQYFADGVTDDLTTDLSRIADMSVISRNTAFTYRNKPVDTKQIGRELGVRYVLEGSVRRSESKVRVNAQLIDAENDAHLWAEQFDGEMGDLFALQNEITSRIAIELNLELIAAETARPAESADALDYILRGRAAMYKPRSRETFTEAIGLFERALTLDQGSIEAQSLLAIMLVGRVLDFGSSSEDADIRRAEALAAKAVLSSPRSALAHAAKANVLRVQRHCKEAIPEYETVLAANHNWVEAIASIGRCKIYVGAIEEGIAAQERALRLSPRDPYTWIWFFRIGEGHLLQSRIDDAILWLEKARNANPAPSFVHAYLASAYAIKGEAERAVAELAEARKLGGERSWQSVAQARASTRLETPAVGALAEATLYVGLRKAGVPEE
jgi:TolB-like protein/class 3 adenylate cyclase